MKAFVITLLDNPQSVEVAERCIASGKRNGIEIEKFKAITPDDDPIKLLKQEGIDPNRFEERFSRNLNCISAFLSHYSLWKQCGESNDTYAIFEHDSVIVAPLPNVPFLYAMNIGAPSYGKWNTPPNIGVNQLTTKKYFPGAHAYMITPSGGKRLVGAASTHARPTDIYLNLDTFPYLQEYYPFVAEARDSFTTIQTEVGCQAKHNYKEGYKIINA